jgi:hypothetical protein
VKRPSASVLQTHSAHASSLLHPRFRFESVFRSILPEGIMPHITRERQCHRIEATADKSQLPTACGMISPIALPVRARTMPKAAPVTSPTRRPQDEHRTLTLRVYTPEESGSPSHQKAVELHPPRLFDAASSSLLTFAGYLCLNPLLDSPLWPDRQQRGLCCEADAKCILWCNRCR